MTARQVVAAAMSEADLQTNILDLCRYWGLLVHHCRPALTDKGWRTPIQGHPGFVDLVIVGRGGVLFREVKAAGGRMSIAQRDWRGALQVAGADVGVWRPEQWMSGHIRAELDGIRKVA